MGAALKKENLLLVLSLTGAAAAQWVCWRYGPQGADWPLLLFLPFLYLFQRGMGPVLKPERKVEREWVLFSLILLLAAFLRLFRLEEVPGGLYYDASALGLHALRFLHEGWEPPFMLPSFAANPSFSLYLLAGWFQAAGESPKTLLLFFSLFSLAAFPFIYWTFRTWWGPGTALTALFLLSVMRWHLHFSRDGFRGILTPFFIFGCLAFLAEGLKGKRAWPFFLSALFLAGGLYTYQSFKVFPLLAGAILLYTALREKEVFQSHRRTLLLCGVLVAALTAPILLDWAQRGSLGSRESEIFIGKRIQQEGSLVPLLEQTARVLSLFNLKGDPLPRHNHGGLPQLDPITGLLFLLGLAAALRAPAREGNLIALSGFFLLCLPGILASDEPQSHRLLGALPFAALLAAMGWRALLSRLPGPKGMAAWVTPAVLVLIGVLNLKAFFGGPDPDCASYRSHSREAALVGERVHSREGAIFYLPPAFFFHPTVQFTAYRDRARVELLDWDLLRTKPPSGEKVVFVLEEGKGPTLEFLQSTLPGGRTEVKRDPCGRVLAYFYEVKGTGAPWGFQGGLMGSFFHSLRPEGKPLLLRRDPLINFTHAGDLWVQERPMAVRWTGRLRVERPGVHLFRILTGDEGRLFLDGKQVPADGAGIPLRRGDHDLTLELLRAQDRDTALSFHLLWKVPGAGGFEVVPHGAFAPLRPGTL